MRLELIIAVVAGLLVGAAIALAFGRPPHRLHDTAARWLPTIEGYRTFLMITILGGSVVSGVVFMLWSGRVDSADVAGIVWATAGLATGSVAGYAGSKWSSGRRRLAYAEADFMDEDGSGEPEEDDQPDPEEVP